MKDWSLLGKRAAAVAGTPCFVMSERVVHGALTRLHTLESSVRLRQWVSLKTQPVARLVQAAIEWGIGIEVVSMFELEAARRSGVPANRILVNGVGKNHWLPSVANLAVHFDSVAEVRELADLAKTLQWQVGLRCAIPQRIDGIEATQWDQFGMTPEQMAVAAGLLARAGVTMRGLHFHIHTNVERASEYQRALVYLREVAAAAGFAPDYVDVGGGLPIPGERAVHGPSASSTFEFDEFRDVLRSIPALFPSVHEVWLENGRFLTGPSGALVVTVLDKKERGGRTYLICDGGRTNHARLSATEVHDLVVEPERGGPLRETVVCGPTCGAVDCLGTWPLPDSVVPGDRIMWLNAGAYHIPLETRFSFGLAPVVWFNKHDEPEIVRERETPEQWWAQWSTSSRRMADAVSG